MCTLPRLRVAIKVMVDECVLCLLCVWERNRRCQTGCPNVLGRCVWYRHHTELYISTNQWYIYINKQKQRQRKREREKVSHPRQKKNTKKLPVRQESVCPFVRLFIRGAACGLIQHTTEQILISTNMLSVYEESEIESKLMGTPPPPNPIQWTFELIQT